jgi:thioredoxin 1
MTEIPHTGAASFQRDVLDSPLPVIVDFTAVWCGPCKMLAPLVEQLAQEWAGKARFYKLDVDVDADLAVQYQVLGVPALLMFVKGKEVARTAGYQPKDRIMAKFKPHL